MEVGKNKMGTTLIIVLLVALVLSIIAGFTVLYIKMAKGDKKVEPATTSIESIAMEDISIFSTGKVIVTNLQEGPDKESHVIRLGVNLGIDISKKKAKDAEALLLTLEEKKPIVNDIITSVCRSKTFEELKRNDAKVILKDEILLKIQKKFNTNLIVDVYIDEIFLD